MKMVLFSKMRIQIEKEVSHKAQLRKISIAWSKNNDNKMKRMEMKTRKKHKHMQRL